MRKLGADGKEQRSANFYKAPYVTTTQFAALSPIDGDEVYLIVDATNGVIWHLRYNAGSSSVYKWEYLGGPPLRSTVDTQETTTSTSFTNLATVGPSIALPRDGDYDVAIGCYTGTSTGNQGNLGFMSYAVGAATALDADEILHSIGAQGDWQSMMGTRRKTGITASTLTAKYYANVGTTFKFGNRWMQILPVRIS